MFLLLYIIEACTISPMAHKIRFIAISIGLYFVGITVIGLVLVGVTALLLKQHAFSSAKFSATIARAALLPHTLLADETSFWDLTDTSLRIAQRTPSLFHNTQLIYHTVTNQRISTLKEVQALDTDLAFIDTQLNKIIKNQEKTGPLKHTLFNVLKTDPSSLSATVSDIRFALTILDPLLLEYADSFATSEPKRYLVLLQNNMELRPSGGFMGSYAEIALQEGKLMHFEVQDIYVPDGQLDGHVEPPLPIQEAFQQGFWKLRDANWHPDFEKSANNVEWFFEQALSHSVHGVVAINFSTVELALHTLGELYIPDYQQTVSADELYVFLQHEVESDFFPGSTKKRDLLASLTRQLGYKLQDLSPNQTLELLRAVVQEAQDKNIQFHFDTPPVQDVFAQHNLAGLLRNTTCGLDCVADYFSVYEANLGVNKSNCCVTRTISLDKKTDNDKLTSSITLNYFNPGPPEELRQLAGMYKSYVRIYLPKDSPIDELTINNQPYQEFVQTQIAQGNFSPITSLEISESTVNNLKEMGFWVVVPEQQETVVRLNTTNSLQKRYQLTLQKQSGTTSKMNFLSVRYNDQRLYEDTLRQDTLITP